MKTKYPLILTGLLVISVALFSFKDNNSVSFTPESISLDSSFAEVYPTPFEKELFVKGFSAPEQEVRIEVYSAGNGILVRTVVLENPLSSSQASIDMSGLKGELFVIRVYEGNKLLTKKRVIKNL